MSGLHRLDEDARAGLVHRYRNLMVPSDEQLSFHIKHHRRGWLHAKWSNGEAKLLDNPTLERHLRGELIVGARWPWDGRVRLVVFDLDAARMSRKTWTKPDLPSIPLRIAQIKRAMSPARLQIVRSSNSGGVHLYMFLDGSHPARDVREVVVERLRSQEVRLRDGVIELWPNNRALRLPLGTGSHWA